MNTQKINEAQEVVEVLRKERIDLPRLVKETEEKLDQLNRRFSQIHSDMVAAQRMVRNLHFPVLNDNERDWRGLSRVIAVDDKWITIRFDNDNETEATRYRRKDGLRENARAASSWSQKIDVAKALQIWEEWNKPEVVCSLVPMS